MHFLVEEIFNHTVQGEGYWAGTYVDFVRLFGCPVGCYFCDQNYQDGGKNNSKIKLTINEIIAKIESERIVLTGGEPLIQPNVKQLIKQLNSKGITANIETSGISWVDITPNNWVTLSPKYHLNKKYPIDNKWWERANEIKLVISEGNELDYYPQIMSSSKLIYLQPEWSNKEQIIPKILNILKQNPHMKLSQQTHKFAKLP